MPLVETITASDKVEEFIANVKDDSDFWNADPLERAKPDYVGFRSIRNNRVCQDIDEDSFPILFVDADTVSFVNLNRSCSVIGENIILHVSMLYDDDDAEIAITRKKLEVYLVSLLQTAGLEPVDVTQFYEDILKGYKTLNLATKVQLS